MLSRVVFILTAAFWVLMNVLLWRAEFGPHDPAGSPVPVQLVWQKILTAPDSSSLGIVRDGKKIGFCNWVTSVGEEWAELNDANLPASGPGKPRSYRLRLEGNAIVAEWTNRIRFEGTLKLAANGAWQDWGGRLSLRPVVCVIHASAADQTVQVRAQADGEYFERVFTFSELQNPGPLIGEFMGPLAGRLSDGMGLPLGLPDAGVLARGMVWEARETTLRIGEAQVRVYRLQTRLLDRYPVTLMVSRVGEILRVELPGEVVLVNDQLGIY